MKKNILIVFGTRPEAIKMAPVVKAFRRHSAYTTKVCVTGQHREMLDQVISFFDLEVDFDLNLMKPGQNLHSLTSAIISGVKEVMDAFMPDLVLVHGDTTTSTAAALSAFYSGAKVGHVEAGLRTYNKYAPFPEEMNRQLTGRLADFHFSPTEKAKINLLSEGVSEGAISVTGNTVIDALMEGVERIKNIENHPGIERLKQLTGDNEVILITGHRRENFGQGFNDICTAIKKISSQFKGKIVYPVHLNPNVQDPVNKSLRDLDNVILIEPLPYESFLWLMNRSKIILTDSGGIQEEAPSLGKPVLVMRETTERPEAVEAGTVKLVGTDVDKIVTGVLELLKNNELYHQMSTSYNPYGDGKASQRIVEFVEKNL
ncbi:non-hydrolyzing UDP-N-acetylglucosamine 2-epimerase [Alkalitalea saponilacus]|uniref:UDP-N-acetylglucosamine 2-epimerase (non-hydrolyzing) n=1 Tax=Alkalitalea saponilacus TaxID=889453 RepID=A0A1T5FKM5_9BACT|nr:UDP-N-acetylglucosamine 2-epimerase (non-hydrolyzing) [Alkalitalea saponilacus]ASB51124.1 UDP-N-acetylglucosamine 2-epimerase (non-hydrolyzing) [Alkalitalea saponilacus]SKB96642.1 UDP-N-acetylglucosamine 2-epimerase (non-hydrolysing) [Alkalitalea saponilacus]